MINREQYSMANNLIVLRRCNHLWFVVFSLFVVWYLLIYYIYDWNSNPVLTSFPLNPENLQLTETPKIDVAIIEDPNSIISTPSPHEDDSTIENSRLEEEETNMINVPTNPEETNKINIPTKPEQTSSNSTKNGNPTEPTTEVIQPDSSCSGRYVYVHEIPTRFNQDLLDNCHGLNNWTNMCQYMENMGLGPHLRRTIPGGDSFYATHQFSLEVIFHNRMKQYKCLTNNSSMASAVFVPYYSGLDVARYLWGSTAALRDAGAIDLYEWLRNRSEWKVMAGRDHFMVAGRITWDFRRGIDKDSAWGNKLMLLPESQNLTMLTIESSPWNMNDFAIPYPTYFHPSTDKEVSNWQNRMKRTKRRYLYSFAGGQRPKMEDSIRGEIMNQCESSSGRKCKLMECKDASNKCLKPGHLMKIFLSSVFCLQPPGDSFTRRSIFDSIVAGCIPVFFHPASAYTQYLWHLPRNYKKYSVLIPEGDVKAKKVRIESVLGSMKRSEVMAMRGEVIKLIPKVVYGDPRSRLRMGRMEDAFDLTMKGVLERIQMLRMENGYDRVEEQEEFNWKYRFFGRMDNNNEWDHYFKRRDKVIY